MSEYEMALKYFKVVLNMALSTLPVTHTDLASAYNNIATVYDEKNQYSEALVNYYKALDIYLANNISNHKDLSTVHTNIAINEKCTGNFSTAIKHYQLALEIELNYSTPNLLQVSKLYQVMGQSYEKLVNSYEAVTHYEKSLVYRSQSSAANCDQEWFIQMYNIIGSSYKLQGEYVKALANYTKAKELMMKGDVLNNIDLAAICINIAHTSLENDGSIENALKIYDDAVNYLNCVEQLTNEHISIAVTVYYNIAKLHFERNDIELALINFEKVLELKLSCMMGNDSSIGATYNNIGQCYTQKGDLSQAIINFNRAVQIHLSNNEADPLNLAIYYNNMAIVYTNHREYVNAIEVMNRLIEIKRITYDNNLITSEDLASAYDSLAIVYQNNKNYLQAYLNYRYALDKIQLSDNYSMLTEIYRSIGGINMLSKRYDEAIEYYNKALERSSILDDLTISLIYNEIGLAYCRIHSMQMALDNFNIALNIQLTKLPAHSLSATHTYNLLGEAYHEMTDFNQAINYHVKAIKLILTVCNSNESPCTELVTAYNRLACIYCQQHSYEESLLYFALTLEAQLKRKE
jgi:tetratricopeptide (TPR) repeat protein